MSARPLSDEELELWHGWKHANDAVLNGVGRELQARADLSGADFGVLSRLVDLGAGELRQQALADSMGWDKSRLSHQLSRMEERGLLERCREGAKLVQVRITRRGRAALKVAREAHAAAVRACLLDAIPAAERPHLLVLLRRLSAAER